MKNWELGIGKEKVAGLQVYPNPSTGEVIIISEQLTINNVEIFDISGRNVGAYPCGRPLNSDNNKITIDISHLPDGVYFLKIGNEMVRVVKQ